MPYTIDFSQRTIVVTGGNRGIGFALSEAVSQTGANLAIIYRGSKDAPEVAENLAKKYGIKAKAYQHDISSPDTSALTQLFKHITNDLGAPITGVVANAGIAIVKPALQYTKEDYDKQLDTNVWGVFAIAQAAAQLWIDQGYKKGSIVVISSMSSKINNKGLEQVFYNVSKSAASAIVRNLAAEWAPYGIRINAVCPGVTETAQTHGQTPEHKAATSAMVPLGRYAQPDEMAGQTILLLSEKTSYQTGNEYFIDGGYLVW